MRILMFLLVILTVACQKEYPYPSNDYKFEKDDEKPGIPISGKWVVIGGLMYVRDLELGTFVYYNHFGLDKDSSDLNYCGVADYDLQIIEINKTTYSFYPKQTGYGTFILNDDTTRIYGLNTTANHITIIENPFGNTQYIGGSAVPLIGRTVDYENDVVELRLNEGFCSGLGHNYKFFNIVIIKKIESW